MALAAVSDVQVRLGRPLTTAESELASVLLEDAERRLLARVPDLLTRTDLHDTAAAIEAEAAARVLRNPGGYRTESEGDYSYGIDTRAAAGFLTILEEEWRALGLNDSGAFTINPFTPWSASGRPANWWELNS